jgi:hypothetical protein
LTEVVALELLAAAEQERSACQAVRAERRADPCASPRQFLVHETAVDVRGAGAAVSLRDLCVHEAKLPGLLNDVLGPGAVFVVLPSGGPDRLGDEVVCHRTHVFLLFSEGEVNH